MEISYLGHASFKLKGKSSTVVTDPFDEKIGIKFPKTSADIVTISHDHFDHNSADKVDDVKKVINGPGEYEIAGVSIIGIPSFHDLKKGEERGKNTIYVFEIDGVRICHLGDLGHTLSESTLNQIGDVDVLLIPVGGTYTIGPKKASEVVSAIEPTYIVPMHFKDDKLDKKAFGDLKDKSEFVSELGLPVEQMDKLQVKKAMIDEDQKIVILKRK